MGRSLSKLPTADDEYTPEQRRIIDARLAKADADIRAAGRVSRAFSDHGQFITALQKEANLQHPSLRAPKNTPRARTAGRRGRRETRSSIA